MEEIETILRYIATSTDRESRDELRFAVTKVIQTERESIMPTIAEEWKQEGLEEGGQQEIAQGELIGCIRFLEELIGRSLSSNDSLASLTLEELQRKADELNTIMRGRE